MPAVARESLSETLLRSRWGGAGLSPETGQVMMSAPWSVRERAFSRKFSLKDSICFRDERVQALWVPELLTPAGGALLQPILLGSAG